MTQSSWPFANQDTSETQYSYLMSKFHEHGVFAVEDASSDCKVFGDSSGMQVKVPIGFAMIRGFMYWNDAQATVAIGAASASPRKDLVVLRLDPSVDSIVLAVKAGTPAGSPVDPSLTQTDTGIYEIPLARVNVATSTTTISAGIVDDLRPFLSRPFGRWTTNKRPSSPYKGQIGLNLTLMKPEFYDGSTWKIVGYDAADLTGTFAGTTSGDHTGLVKGKGFSIQQATPTPVGVGHVWISW